MTDMTLLASAESREAPASKHSVVSVYVNALDVVPEADRFWNYMSRNTTTSRKHLSMYGFFGSLGRGSKAAGLGGRRDG